MRSPFFLAIVLLVALPQLLLAELVYPLVSERISSNYGLRKHPIRKSVRHHNGIDLAAPNGAHVRAVKSGLVVFASNYKGYGNLITVKHKDETYSLYGHLSKIDTKVGKKVKAGEVIGRVGSTGASTGNHLHFEWRIRGKAVDPLKVLPGLGKVAEG